MYSALVVVVTRAAPLVDEWRERTAPDKPSMGVPAHVTLLMPFVPAEEIDDALLAEVGEVVAGFPSFGFTLAQVGRFERILYLAPEPAGPFVELAAALAARFPDYPPYEGKFGEMVPHLTFVHGEAEVLDEAEAQIVPKLPLTTRATEVTLLAETERRGPWHARASFPLGGR